MDNLLLGLFVGLVIVLDVLFYLYYKLTVRCEELECEILRLNKEVNEIITPTLIKIYIDNERLKFEIEEIRERLIR